MAAGGMAPAPHQAALLDRSHRLDEAGLWRTPEVGLIISRQNGKTETLAARLLAEVLVGGSHALYVAHAGSSALAMFRRCRALAESVPALSRLIGGIRAANGQQAITGRSGATLLFLTATGKPPRGLTGVGLIAYDEAMHRAYSPDLLAALNPTQAAHPNPMTLTASSAGDARSSVLNALRDRGRAAAERGATGPLSWTEYAAPAGCDLTDPDALAAANPALGGWLTADYLTRQAETLPEPLYRTEHLGQWVELLDRWLPTGVLAACSDPTATVPDTAVPSFGFDAAPDLSGGAVVAAWLRADGLTHVETVARFDPASGPVAMQAERRVLALAQRWRRSTFGYDPRGPLAALGDRLTAARIRTSPIATADLLPASQLFAQLATAGELVHPADAVLLTATDRAVPHRRGDTYAFRRRDAAGDVSPLYAAVIATWHARTPVGRAMVRAG